MCVYWTSLLFLTSTRGNSFNICLLQGLNEGDVQVKKLNTVLDMLIDKYEQLQERIELMSG